MAYPVILIGKRKPKAARPVEVYAEIKGSRNAQEERAEKAKAKQKAEKSTPNTKKPTHTPTFDKKKKKAALKPEDVHHLADKLNIPWDNDPDFLEWTKGVTSKEHLDDLNQSELKSVMTALNERKAFWVRLSHVTTQEDPIHRVASRWITAGAQAFADFEKAIGISKGWKEAISLL